MKNYNKQLFIFSLTIVLLCFISVIIFTLPALVAQLDLSSKSNIGSALGGITAPIIGIISSVLLYLTLNRQVESNIDQRIKNESDIIFLLLNQLDNEISGFYYHFTETKGNDKKEYNYSGVQGLNVFIKKITSQSALSNFQYTFKAFYQSNQILLILRSYCLIEKRIQISPISEELKKLFEQKLHTVYDCRLKESLHQLCNAIEKNSHVKDVVTEEIYQFCKDHDGTTANMGFAASGAYE